MTLSARNRLEGKIVELQLGGVAHVVMRVGDNLIESVITKRSADEMHLKVGDTVSAIIKSTEVSWKSNRTAASLTYEPEVLYVAPNRPSRCCDRFFCGADCCADIHGNVRTQNRGCGVAPLSLTAGELKNMPRTSLRVTNAHDKKKRNLQGCTSRGVTSEGRRSAQRAASRPAYDQLRRGGSAG
jgi:molybdopterin-binding protein